ncbi:uncharacterized protein LOC112182882 isoform X1 [Rosa chinensis]|uniref:uncharacterized protein LOC112182882 isoform X1 n=1 Tax=Rosa chinensis TaxID=74649 RepID=UPI001AD90F68|nr:uncharacterized protein LOC112182882 isoform X1 [Rosa chinensis]
MNDHNSKWVPTEVTLKALETLKAALANCEMVHRAEAKQKSIPRFQPDPEKHHKKLQTQQASKFSQISEAKQRGESCKVLKLQFLSTIYLSTYMFVTSCASWL